MIEVKSLNDRLTECIENSSSYANNEQMKLKAFLAQLLHIRLDCYFWAYPWAVKNIDWLLHWKGLPSAKTYEDILHYFDDSHTARYARMLQLMFLPFFAETEAVSEKYMKHTQYIRPYCHDPLPVRRLEDREEYARLMTAYRDLCDIKLKHFNKAVVQMSEENSDRNGSERLNEELKDTEYQMGCSSDYRLYVLMASACYYLGEKADGITNDKASMNTVKLVLVDIPRCVRNKSY